MANIIQQRAKNAKKEGRQRPGRLCFSPAFFDIIAGMKTMRLTALGFLLLALVACASRRGDEPRYEPVAAAAGNQEVFQSGVASWYGDDFQGKVTANGEIYDMHKLTAAHPDLPFHTLVEVENLENGKKVLVRVNDRGPFLKGRIIDLSLKAAQRLEIAEKGTAEVSLRVIRWGGDAANGAAPVAAARGYFVQAGAFTLRENAEDILQTLADIFPGLAFRIAAEDGMFKVISMELPSLGACSEVIRELAAHHLQGFIRETGPGEKN
jgi:rare lipoprotein A